MILKRFQKQAAETEIYDIDWASEYLESVDDEPGNLVALTHTSGITVTPQVNIGEAVPGGILKIKVSGGESGKSYRVTAMMSTADDREKEADVVIDVRG